MEQSFSQLIVSGYKEALAYLRSEVMLDHDYKPWWANFFYWLVFISGVFLILEWVRPWRKKQARFRKDFWLDFGYMFFNLFGFYLLVMKVGEDILVTGFNEFCLAPLGLQNIVAIQLHEQLPVWAYYLVLFVVADFLQWNIHRLLHRVPWLWEFHKVHHSVEEMGFAAHLRYHWMENIVYKGLQAIPLTMIGYYLPDLLVLHMFNIAWGHFNHANITVSPKLTGTFLGSLLGFGLGSLYPLWGIGPEAGLAHGISLLVWVLGGALFGRLILSRTMHRLFNSPEMHIWHHARTLPEDRRYGVNFGLTLALWDHLFGTAYIPENGRDVPLGFEDMQAFPKGFWGQLIHGLPRGWKKKVGTK